MNRVKLLQQIINKGGFKRYLEIGSYQGQSLLPLRCKTKIAVDPAFKISNITKFKAILKNPSNLSNRYFELKSEDFFEQKRDYLKKDGKLDVIFIDGLHTFRASLLDVLNSLEHLAENGIIIMHDCFPPHRVAAIPLGSFQDGKKKNVEGWTGEWCGDVWKTICYLRENHKDLLDVFVINTDYGLGVIRYKEKVVLEKPIVNKATYKRIDALDYEHLMNNPKEVIALRDTSSIPDLLNTIA